MSRFIGINSITGISTLRNVGGSDVTPDAVNWTDASQFAPPFTINSNTVTFSGINAEITLNVTVLFNDGTLRASKNSGALFDPSASNFTVQNGDTLYFQFDSSGGAVSFQVYNVTDNNTLLDSCVLEILN